MNTSYGDLTRQVGDQWVVAFKQAEEAVPAISKNVQEATPAMKLPVFPVPESIATLGNSLSGRLPNPAEILEANFTLTQRLLTAQRDLALRLLDVADQGKSSSK